MPYGFMPAGEPRFGEVAEAYDAFRVGYTALVYEHLARRCGLQPGADVLDLGCGTGISTTPLLERGANVIAVDPDETMLQTAERHVGARAQLLMGRAEDLPLADASLDLVVCAQSAHWFREPAASREIHRVLRPGGAAVYLWKYPAPETRYTYLVDELLVKLTGKPIRTSYTVGTVPELLMPGWEGYERAVFEQPVAYTRESYVGFVSSRDRIRQIAGDRRDDLLELLDTRLRDIQPSGAFVERNLVYVVSARAVSG